MKDTETFYEKYKIGEGWISFFEDNIHILDHILSAISEEDDPYFPYEDELFRFTAVAPDKVKGMILGMEPYMSYTRTPDGDILPEATGRSFEAWSVRTWDQKIVQASLRNILKAIYYECTLKHESDSLDVIRKKISSGEFPILPPHLWFKAMEDEGIMFLNTALTVRLHAPGSHLALWKPFTSRVIEHVAKNSPDACFMLFGKDAKKAAEDILKDKTDNIVITSHPRISKFIEEEPFTKIRSILMKGFKDPLPGIELYTTPRRSPL